MEDSFPQPKSYEEPSTFKFSNQHRQNDITYGSKPFINRPSYNTGEYTANDNVQSVGNSPTNDGSVVYGKYYDNYDVVNENEPPRPPPSYQRRPAYAPNPQYNRESHVPYRPSPSYAQNFNYINNDNKPFIAPQQYPINPSQGRPPYERPQQARPPPHYYQANYRPPNPSVPAMYQSSNYAGNYNNYQAQPQHPTGTLSITDFISNLGQTASDLFTGGRPQPQHPQYASNKTPIPSSSTAAANPVGMIATAIEAITRHDDLQCIPKIICQMVGGQRNQNSLSPLLGSPVFTS